MSNFEINVRHKIPKIILGIIEHIFLVFRAHLHIRYMIFITFRKKLAWDQATCSKLTDGSSLRAGASLFSDQHPGLKSVSH